MILTFPYSRDFPETGDLWVEKERDTTIVYIIAVEDTVVQKFGMEQTVHFVEPWNSNMNRNGSSGEAMLYIGDFLKKYKKRDV